ncbi:STM3941 family protein [Paenibacillus sp. NPDC057967]|uniref:STM3941 family protein n=1 Tax=Paenibacillus sp. NPDC057967 TaxID=3346293 RepID=UPI0036DF57E8
MGEVSFYRKRGRLIGMSIFGIAGTAVGIFLVSLAFGNSNMVLGLVGGLMAIALAGVAIHNLRILLAASPVLTLSEKGILDHSTYMSGGLIKWEEIEHIGIAQLQGWVFLVIHTYDRNLIINRYGGFKKFLILFNKGLSDGQVHIPFRLLACEPEELLENVAKFYELKGQDDTSLNVYQPTGG